MLIGSDWCLNPPRCEHEVLEYQTKCIRTFRVQLFCFKPFSRIQLSFCSLFGWHLNDSRNRSTGPSSSPCHPPSMTPPGSNPQDLVNLFHLIDDGVSEIPFWFDI